MTTLYISDGKYIYSSTVLKYSVEVLLLYLAILILY